MNGVRDAADDVGDSMIASSRIDSLEYALHHFRRRRWCLMRLLILDGSRILASLVERLTPEGVEVEEVATFDEAVRSLHESPPDAVIANVGPTELPWRDFKKYCRDHRPQIPILFESCVYESPDEAKLGRLEDSAAFLTKPYGLADLRNQLRYLLSFAGSSASLDGAGRTLDTIGGETRASEYPEDEDDPKEGEFAVKVFTSSA
jgi:DNA-binding response OmpR family regulator